MTVDPIHQFEIKRYVDLLNLSSVQFSFTNAAVFMFGIVAIIFFFLTFATAAAPWCRAAPSRRRR